MKIIQKYISRALKTGVIAALFLTSCDKGFKEMNTNPSVYSSPLLGGLFSYDIVTVAGNGDGNTLYPNDKTAGCWVQYFASLNTFQWTGDKYVKKDSYDGGLFSAAIGTELKECQQLINLTKDDPKQSNLYNVCRIWRVYIMHRATDYFGDIPYSEAGQGLAGIYTPKYDKQQDIYTNMLSELDDAAAKLDANKATFGASDLIYSGSVPKWKKFAFSLMLRLGMRVTNADPAMAQTYVKKAIAGGPIASNADNAVLLHTGASNANEGKSTDFYWDGRELRGAEGVPPTAKGQGYGKMNKTFVDYLVTQNDPRLGFYITLWQGNADPTQLPTSTLPAKQRGMPGGYDDGGSTPIQGAIPGWNSAIDLPTISELNLNTIGANNTPSIFFEYAEVEYYLAEAALRGWGSGTAKDHYEAGVRANMQKYSKAVILYPGGYDITTAQIDSYIATHPYPATGTTAQQMQAIYTQFWASFFMQNMNVYANWRRTGYPVLTPTNYATSQSVVAGKTVIPRRGLYPLSESTSNLANYTEAVARQGPDEFYTKMWLDK